MIVDKMGNIECIATQKVVEMPEELMREFGGSWAAIAGGVFLQLSQNLGTFKHAIFYYEKIVLLFMPLQPLGTFFCTHSGYQQPICLISE